MKRFTTDAAHELRTPIAIIRSTAELALRRERDVRSYQASLAAIQQETVHLTRLVEDLMWLARYDAQADSEVGTLAINEIVSEACGAVTPLAEQHGIVLDKDIRLDGAIVLGNRLALRRLFLILLDNALKFTPDDEVVRVVAAEQQGRCCIEIHDRGTGIADEDLDHIFERFYRADSARSNSGFGLGLPIAKAIVEAHRGVIGVAPAKDQGCCFYVHLPCEGGKCAEMS
jgi:signal transduction histidine kinase